MSTPQMVWVACRPLISEIRPIASGLSRVKLNSVVSVQDKDRSRGHGEPRGGGGAVPGQDDALVDRGCC